MTKCRHIAVTTGKTVTEAHNVYNVFSAGSLQQKPKTYTNRRICNVYWKILKIKIYKILIEFKYSVLRKLKWEHYFNILELASALNKVFWNIVKVW